MSAHVVEAGTRVAAYSYQAGRLRFSDPAKISRASERA
jgi:hypothetical protein